MSNQPKNSFSLWLDKKFHITNRNSTIGQEVIGGTTVFMAMVYIIPVSAAMFALAGRDPVTSAIAISLVTAMVSVIMGWFVNVAIALSTGMGLNAFAVFTVCLTMGYPFKLVMICTAIEGVVFFILSLTGLRSSLAKAIPQNIKLLIGGGIGGFLIYIGSQNAHIIGNDDSTLTTMVNFRTEFHTQGIWALMAVVAIAFMIVLLVRGNKAAVFIGMLVVWALGMILEKAGVYIPNPDAGYYSLFFSTISLPSGAAWSGIFIGIPAVGELTGGDIANLVVVTCTMFYSDFFDTVGTAMTCLTNMINKMEDELKEIKDEYKASLMQAEIDGLKATKTLKFILIVDAIGTILGALLCCTTITSFAESNAGEGRTGLSAIVTGLWFAASIFLASVFTTIPGYATGAALIVVGVQMIYTAFQHLDYDKSKIFETFPGILCFIYIILTYNIANGMAFGIVMYTIVCLFSKDKEHRKKLGILMPVLSILLVIKFAWL